MTDAPDAIWIEDEFGDGHEDQWAYGSWDCRNCYGYNIKYVRADIHQALESERDRLRDALAPYADLAKHHAADAPEWGPFDSVTAIVSIRNLREAHTALGESND